MIAFDVVDEVALDIVDAAVGEHSDVDLGAHRGVVSVFLIRALLRPPNANEHGGDARQQCVQGLLSAVVNARTVLVGPPACLLYTSPSPRDS